MKTPTTHLAFLFILSLIVACAHVVPLSGGKKDKVKPYVTGVYPADKSTNVSHELKTIFQFSEWIQSNPSSYKSAVTISPPLEKVLRFDVDGDKLIITSRSELDSNTTYSMVLSTDVKDLQNNPLYSPYHLIFSTGPSIDTLELKGSVQYPVGVTSKLSSKIKIGLYPKGSSRYNYGYLKQFADTNGVIAELPDFFQEKPLYITGTDSTGSFYFKGLKSGSYDIIAFEDNNRNSIFDVKSENVALPASSVTIGKTDNIALTLYSLDTNALQLAGVEPLFPDMLKLKFNKTPDLKTAVNISNFRVTAMDSSTEVGIKGVYINPTTQNPILVLDSIQHDSSYILWCFNITDSLGATLDSSRSYSSFTWITRKDTLPPRILTTTPKNQAQDQRLDTAITVFYDKPVDVDNIQYLITAGEDTLAYSAKQINTNTIALKTDKQLPNSARIVIYSLFNDTTIQLDSSGASDTTTEVKSQMISAFNTFEMINSTVFSGSIPKHSSVTHTSKINTPIVVSIQNQKTRNIYTTRSTQTGTFTFSDVPEGPYFMEYFYDINTNGRWDPGSLKPFTYSEPYFRIKDTLKLLRGSNNSLEELLQSDSSSTQPEIRTQ